MKVESFRDLIVWQKAMELVTLVYRVSADFPPSEQFALTNQIRRAAVSIPSNIAEGYGRRSRADYIRFLRIASGSLYEMQTQIEIARNLAFTESQHTSEIDSISTEIERMLASLINKLETKQN
ncbi:four helix bundle protein [Cerasicoccus maritimus]|uniref:four helix bundle protein n=1 Tax=Cerasicoccus maritimus TaxID=490089 RepID=UPI00285289C4|nr:four helix bundle protein [Cerasicoccus maritimus]